MKSGLSRRKAKASAPAPVVTGKPTKLVKAAHTAFLITPNSIHHQVTNAHGGAYMAIKREQSAQISLDLEAFLANGGAIEKLDVSASSRPLLATYGEYADMIDRKQIREKARQRGGFKKEPKPVEEIDESNDIEE